MLAAGTQWPKWSFAGLAILAVSGAACLAIAFASQLTLEAHSFRQTQTALTAFWFTREGFKLAYETPVAGYPWAIPFEFPFYQYAVAALSMTLGLSIATAGRLMSFACLILCIPVVRSINKRLSLPPAVLAAFAALAFSSPLYVFWGRSVMIETAALLLAIIAIKFFLDFLLGGRRLGDLLLFSAFMSLCMLQKATTGLPVLMVLGAVLAGWEWANFRNGAAAPKPVTRAALMLCVLIPLAAGIAWTHYTDTVKVLNPLGPDLTSASLAHWNWGTLEQRVSLEFWLKLVLIRVLAGNMGLILGPGLLLFCFLSNCPRQTKYIMSGAILLGVLPLFLFANLHIFHDYYQASNVMFLIYAMAVAIGAVIVPRKGEGAAFLLLLALVATNYAMLGMSYLPAIATTFDRNQKAVAIGEVLKRELPPDGQFVAFGNDWSSTFAYLSERKSFTVPNWFPSYDKVIARPQDYVERGRLGAVVSCATRRPEIAQLIAWADSQGPWKVGETNGCAMAVPGRDYSASAEPGPCLGAIEAAGVEVRGDAKVIRLSGWSATGGASPAAADAVFLMLSTAGKPPAYVDTLAVPRLDESRRLGVPEDGDLGFSRLLPASLAPGRYDIGIIQQSHGRFTLCPMIGQLHVEG
ncbi:hypothetical protein [Aestuariivirga sp.]|uniref:hypothetical protein n=1 Tax=Aestuariivirga sp. TaxID=2650926 RepID=UPI003BAB4D57